MTLAVMYCLLLYVSKLEFKTEIRKSVTIYYQQIAQYFDYKKKPVPQYLNHLVINRVYCILKSLNFKKTIITYGKENVLIGICGQKLTLCSYLLV